MRCAECGQTVQDGTRFCPNCGAALQEEGAVMNGPGTHGSRPRVDMGRQEDPYKDKIAQLKLDLRERKLELKKTNTGMSNTRSQYHQTASFVPHGLLRRGYKWFENLRLLGPQHQKQNLQDEILEMEQELLRLQQAQAEWKTEQRV